MKKSLVLLIFLGVGLLATDRVKLDKMTNFSNYKTYTISLNYNEYRTNRVKIKPSRVTNGMFKYTIQAMLFQRDEGKLEDLTKQQIDALPETPYKHFQLRRYAYANANNFNDISFLYSREGKEVIRKQASGEIKNFFQEMKRIKIKKILMAIRTKGDKIFIIYEQDLKMPDGTLSDKSWSRYFPLALGKEDGRWVEVKIKQTPDLNAMWNWSWFAYDRKKTGLGRSGGDINKTFFSEFKEVDK